MLLPFLPTPPPVFALMVQTGDEYLTLFDRIDGEALQDKPEDRITLLEQALTLARQKNNPDRIVRCLLRLALETAKLQKTSFSPVDPRSLPYAEQARKVIEANPEHIWKRSEPETVALMIQTNYLQRASVTFFDPAKSREWFRKALAINDSMQSSLLADRVKVKMGIALTYVNQQDFAGLKPCLDDIKQNDYNVAKGSDRAMYHLMRCTYYLSLGASGRKELGNEYFAMIPYLSQFGDNQIQIRMLFSRLFPNNEREGNAEAPNSINPSNPFEDSEFTKLCLAVSEVFLNVGREEKAKHIADIKKALTFFLNKGNFLLAASIETVLGDIALKQNLPKEAETRFAHAVELFESNPTFQKNPYLIGAVQAFSADFYSLYAEAIFRQEGGQRAAEALCIADSGRGQALRRLAMAQRTSPPFAPAKKLAHLSESDLQKLAQRHPGTLYLHYNVVDADRTLLFACSAKGGLKTFYIGGDDVLNQQTDEWRTSITRFQSPLLKQEKDKPKWREEEHRYASTLYQTLLQKVEEAGLLKSEQCQRIVFLPHHSLWGVPFGALRDGEGKRLIERFPLSVALSLGALLKEEKPLLSPSLRFFADPYGETITSALPKQNSILKNRRLTLGPGKHPLPTTRAFVLTLPQNVSNAKGLVGSAMQKQEVIRMMKEGDILFFGTHGVLEKEPGTAEQGLNSYLSLAKAKKSGASSSQEQLTAFEVSQFFLKCVHTILMACDSGQGSLAGGEGVYGLVWGFQAAGCPSLVASQWPVNERLTTELLKIYWQELLAGQSKDDALRHAMLHFKTDPKSDPKYWDSPYFWAGFQVYGTTTPLMKPSKTAAIQR